MSSVSFILCGKHPVYGYDTILITTFSDDLPLKSVNFFIAQSEKNGEPRMSILRRVLATKIINEYKRNLKFGDGGILADSLSSYNLDNPNLINEVAPDIVFLKGLNMKLKNMEKLSEGYDMRDPINHSDVLDEIIAEVEMDDYGGGARAPPPEKRVYFFIDLEKKAAPAEAAPAAALESEDAAAEKEDQEAREWKYFGGGGSKRNNRKSKRRKSKKRKTKRRKSKRKSKRRRRRSR